MKKTQNLFTKPDQLRRKLESPSFRHDFVQWSKNNLNGARRQNTTKSPSQRKLKFNNSKSKQNINPNNLNQNNSLNKKNNIIKNISQIKNTKTMQKLIKGKIKSHSTSHFNSLNQHNRSLNQFNNQKNNRSSYSSLNKNKQQNKSKKKLNQDVSFLKKNNLKQIKYKYSIRTKQGVLQTNPNKVNQDRYLINQNIGKDKKTLFSVADGHGLYGHIVSQYLMEKLPNLCNKYLNQTLNSNIPHNNNHPLSQIYNDLQNGLQKQFPNQSYTSGSTLVSVLMHGNKNQNCLTIANTGDSRAILARQLNAKNWEVVHLSEDHKPSLQVQKKRIIKNGGRVQALRDSQGRPIGPMRVWLPNQNSQGLAMSRSLGDNISKQIGVTHYPTLLNVPLSLPNDKFIVVGSDGLWQFVNHLQVLRVVVPFYRQGRLQQACDALLQLAYQKWTYQDCSVVDDITFILIFLDQ